MFKSIFSVLLMILMVSCSSAPKSNSDSITQEEAQLFLKKYCSKFNEKSSLDQELRGETVIRSNTKEFKGQYPASIHFSKDKKFNLEVTNLIGGTVALLKGDSQSVEVNTPGNPKQNQKGIQQYMGLTVPLFAKLLHGDLPCPDQQSVSSAGNVMVMRDQDLEWRIERSDADSGMVPVKVVILEKGKIKVELTIERWNIPESYAEKVKVHTSEGDLKWTWRSRELK